MSQYALGHPKCCSTRKITNVKLKEQRFCYCCNITVRSGQIFLIIATLLEQLLENHRQGCHQQACRFAQTGKVLALRSSQQAYGNHKAERLAQQQCKTAMMQYQLFRHPHHYSPPCYQAQQHHHDH
jgi:hypothetical protein